MSSITYIFSQSTGEFIKERKTLISSIDKSIVMPAFGTLQIPPVVSTNQRAVFRDIDNRVPDFEELGSWKIVDDFRGQTYWLPDATSHTITELEVRPPDNASFEEIRTIEQQREDRWDSIKKARNSAEFGVFDWNGCSFDADALSRSRLTLAFFRAQSAMLESDSSWSIEWRLNNNSMTTLTAEDMINVMVALGDHTIQVHEHANQLYALIQAANTKEEIESIVW